MDAVVERITIRPSADGPPDDVRKVIATPGGGLAGDRYANGSGTA